MTNLLMTLTRSSPLSNLSTSMCKINEFNIILRHQIKDQAS